MSDTTIAQRDRLQSPDDKKLASEICKRQVRLEHIRERYDLLWDDIDDYVIGRRSVWDLGNKKGQDRGSRTGVKIYDQTAATALQDFVDGYQGNSAAPTIRWWSAHFRNKEVMKLHDCKEWMDEVEEAVNSEINNSNFYSQLYEATWDRATYGPSTIYGPEWSAKKNKLIYYVRHPREIFYALNSEEEPDLWHRKFPITARQILQDYPDAPLPLQFRKKLELDPYQEYICIHAIFPREERDVTKIDNENKPWASVYVLEGQPIVLEESGYDEPPLTTARWRYSAGEPYPRSIAIDCLYEIMGVNQMSRAVLRSAQLLVEPPYVMSATLKGKLRVVPNGQTLVESATDRVDVLPFPSNLGAGLNQIGDIRKTLAEKFKAKIFSLMTALDTRLTATQVSAMQGEQAVLLGPIVTRDQNENLIPLIHKTFSALAGVGKIPPPPPSILEYAETPVDITFLGPVAMLARRYLQMQGLNSGMGELLPIIKEIPQLASALDRIDPDEWFKYVWEAAGAPTKVSRDDKTVNKMRQAKAQMAQQQMQAQQADTAASVYQKTASAPDKGSPAGMAVEQGQQ